MKIISLLALAALTAAAQDPVKVAAKNYKIIAENENVRILEANLAPGAKTATHAHPALMVVMLQAGPTKWTMPDGKVEQSAPDGKRGDVGYMPAQTHVSENMGKTALKAILVEFKKPAPSAAQAKKAPTVTNCKVVADSPHATAQLCTDPPGSKGNSHTHASDWVVVAMNDGAVEFVDDKGKKRTMSVKKDSATLNKPETHAPVNSGKASTEAILIDLK